MNDYEWKELRAELLKKFPDFNEKWTDTDKRMWYEGYNMAIVNLSDIFKLLTAKSRDEHAMQVIVGRLQLLQDGRDGAGSSPMPTLKGREELNSILAEVRTMPDMRYLVVRKDERCDNV